MASGPWRLAASEADGLGEASGMPKNMRLQNRRVDGLDSLACLQKDVAAQLEENEGGLDHALRAAQLEFDRIATTEVADLVANNYGADQHRMTRWLQKHAPARFKPVRSMSISEVAILSRLHCLGKGAREKPRNSLPFYEFRVWESVEMVVCSDGSIIEK